MKIRFTDSAPVPNELDLSALSVSGEKYKPKRNEISIKYNSDALDKFGISGSYETGDGTVKSRSFDVSCYVIGRNDLEYRQRITRINQFFKAKFRPFYVYDDDNLLRSKILLGSIEQKFKSQGLENIFCELSLKCEMLDSLWEDSSETVEQFYNVSANSTFTVTVADANGLEVMDAFPVIEIVSKGFNPNIVLTNQANNGTIRLSDSNIANGVKLTVSSLDGTVKIGTNLKPAIKTGGYFLKLENGDNIIKIQSLSAADIKVTYRKRYLN